MLETVDISKVRVKKEKCLFIFRISPVFSITLSILSAYIRLQYNYLQHSSSVYNYSVYRVPTHLCNTRSRVGHIDNVSFTGWFIVVFIPGQGGVYPEHPVQLRLQQRQCGPDHLPLAPGGPAVLHQVLGASAALLGVLGVLGAHNQDLGCLGVLGGS